MRDVVVLVPLVILAGCYESYFAVADGDRDVFHPAEDARGDTRDRGGDADADADADSDADADADTGDADGWDAGDPCPPGVVTGVPCSAEPYCVLPELVCTSCGSNAYVLTTETCYCSSSSRWMCQTPDVDCFSPGDYCDPECTLPPGSCGGDADRDADGDSDGGSDDSSGRVETSCNGLDDNGNGVVDEGCPIGVQLDLEGPWTGSWHGTVGYGGWIPWPSSPSPVAVLGGRGGCYVDQIAPTAGLLTLAVDESVTPYSYAVTIGDGESAVFGASSGGEAFSGACGGEDQVISGIFGTTGDMTYLDSLGAHCSSIGIVGDAPYHYSVVVTEEGSFGPFGHDPTCAPVVPFDEPCPAGYVIGTWNVSASGYIDALQVVCYRVTPVLNS